MTETTGHTFRITGRVIDRKTRRGTSGLRVEAWDKDYVLDDFVGSATTSGEGSFEISFDASYFQEWSKDQLPDLFFKVYDREALIANTEDSVLYNVQEGASEVSAMTKGRSMERRKFVSAEGQRGKGEHRMEVRQVGEGADHVLQRRSVIAALAAIVALWPLAYEMWKHPEATRPATQPRVMPAT